MVAATNRDLTAEIRHGRFREDLFHRISHGQLLLPPLREREMDVVVLAERSLSELARDMDSPLELGDDAKTALVTYDWPGNVRELLNTMRRAALLCESRCIRLEDLDLGRLSGWGVKLAKALSDNQTRGYKDLHMLVDRIYLPALLEEYRTVTATAERLGMTRARLRYRLQGLGLHET